MDKKLFTGNRLMVILCTAIFFTIFSSFLAGCGQKESSEGKKDGEQQVPQELVVGVSKDISSKDLLQSRGGPDSQRHLIYETLVEMDADFNLKNGLAESWAVSEDGIIWTFKLKKGIKFHDGILCNAEAVKFSFEKMKQGDGMPIKAIETPDEYTVKFVLSQPYAPFLIDLTYKMIFSPNGSVDSPVGSGPFKFAEWKKGQELIFVRNEDYWGAKPKLEQIIFKVIPDHQTRVMALQAGEIHVADYIPVREIAALEKDPNFEVVKRPSPCMNWIAFNTRQEPFNDVRVRKAFNYAIDVEQIINSIVGNVAIPATKGPLSSPAHSSIVNPDLEWYKANQEKARALLEQAGWKDSDGDGLLDKNGKPFKVSMIASNLYEEGTTIAEAIQVQLRKIGVNMEIELYESGARFEALREGKYQMIELGGICATNDPSSWFLYYFHSQKQPTYCVFENKELDELIDRAYTTVDSKERKQVFYDIQKLLAEQPPGIFLYSQQSVTAASKRVKDFEMDAGMPGAFSYARKAYLS